jgi:hypothetical protein
MGELKAIFATLPLLSFSDRLNSGGMKDEWQMVGSCLFSAGKLSGHQYPSFPCPRTFQEAYPPLYE